MKCTFFLRNFSKLVSMFLIVVFLREKRVLLLNPKLSSET